MIFTQNNMNGGVVSPWIDTRGDLDKFRSSLRKCENFIATPYGGLRRRMGTEHVAVAKGRNRLISYQRTSTEGYTLEFSNNSMRVHKNGSRIDGVEVVTPWSDSEVFEVQYVKINNVIYFSHINHPPQRLRYETDQVWTLSAIPFDHPAFRDFQLDGSKLSVTPSTTVPDNQLVTFDVTGSATEETSDELEPSGNWNVDVSSLVFLDPSGYFKLQQSTDGGFSWIDIESFSSDGSYTGIITGGFMRLVSIQATFNSTFGTSNDVDALSKGDSVTVNSTSPSFSASMVGSEVLVSHTPEVTEQKKHLGSSGISQLIAVKSKCNLFTSGTWRGIITLEKTTDSGLTFTTLIQRTGDADVNLVEEIEVDEPCSVRIRFLKTGSASNNPYGRIETDGSDINGRVLITQYVNGSQVLGVVTAGVYSSDATEFWKESAWSSKHGYPAAITWHESRLWLGGSKADSSTLWASRTDDFFNFEDGTDDDNSFQRTMGTNTLTDIVWLASQSSLFIGTTGEEWRGTSDSDSGVITPVSFTLRRIANMGSERIAPVFSGAYLTHVQREGRSLLQIGYDATSATEDGYAPSDLNELAPHVTLGGVKTMAYQAIRDKIIWATTGEGKLIGLTYNKQQNVSGWHEHTTQGEYSSVATVYEEGYEDSLYFSVKRGDEYHIERARIDQYDILENQDQTEGLYLDDTVFYNGVATNAITGLGYLEGMLVGVVTDGVYLGEYLVDGGEITLMQDVTECEVGLSYTSLMETLPFTFDAGDGSSVGRYKRPSHAILRVYRSVTCEVAQSANGGRKWELMRQEWRKSNDLGLEEVENEQGFIEDWKIPLSSSHDTDARLAVRITEPYPLNIMSVGANIDFTN